MQQGIVKGDVLQRLGSVCFILGAALLVVFNVLLPRATDPSDTQAVLTKVGQNEVMTQVSALLLAVGVWALMIGMAGVYRSISSGGAAVWARLGFYGVIVGTTLFTVTFALLIGAAGAAADWIAASAVGKSTAYSVAASLHATGLAVFSITIIVEWLALTFVSLGLALSTIYPKWLGWVGIILGVVTMIAVGVIQVFAGPGQTTQAVFMILSLLTTLWVLALGLWIARKAW